MFSNGFLYIEKRKKKNWGGDIVASVRKKTCFTATHQAGFKFKWSYYQLSNLCFQIVYIEKRKKKSGEGL